MECDQRGAAELAASLQLPLRGLDRHHFRGKG